MSIMASMSPNLFSSPPPNPRINDPNASQNAPPKSIPILKKKRNPNPSPKPPQNAPLKQSFHNRTKYYKPLPAKKPSADGEHAVISSDGEHAVISSDGDRAVVVGSSGISYLLPNAPFEFQYSYSEVPKEAPLAIREPAFLPFAPRTMPRPWTGKAPLMSKKEKERKKKIRLFEPLGHEEEQDGDDADEGGGDKKKKKKNVLKMIASRRVEELAKCSEGDGRSREEILGAPLTKREARMLVKPLLSTNRQINLGKIENVVKFHEIVQMCGD